MHHKGPPRPGELTLRQDVVQVIVARGELHRDEIKDLWGLDDERYESLRQQLLRERLLEPLRGTGGFRARIARRPLPPEEPGTLAGLFSTEWETQGAERLAELLSHAELEGLLGDLVYTLRRARMKLTGEDRRGTKRELAAALIIAHGVDLFRHRGIRSLVAKRSDASFPNRWHPGKGAALEFVRQAGFPADFTGIPAEDTPADFEYLEGRVDLKPLEPFQLEVQRKAARVLGEPGGRAIVTLPTGGGKTRVAVDTIRDLLTTRWREGNPAACVLWLAHTEELCEQAYVCFRQVWQSSNAVCPLLLFRFWGRFTQDLVAHSETLAALHTQPAVLVSTPQRIVNLLSGRIKGGRAVVDDIQRNAVLLLVDEAHRAAAPSYRTIIEAFASVNPAAAVIGLTATPFREEYDQRDPDAGTRELRRLFKAIIEPTATLGVNPRAALEAQGYLAHPTWETVKTRTYLKAPVLEDPEHLSEADIDRVDYALKIRADNPDRRLTVLERMLTICADPQAQVLYFGPSVLDAECMAFLLRSRGIPAAFVSGATREVTRRRIVADFKSGGVQVLCNCEVLTTGFDAPRVTHVVMARPTVSQVLYEQMIGRGLRGARFGGTDRCVIIDLEDNYRSDRPTLGYQAFRELWVRGRRSAAKAPAPGSPENALCTGQEKP
jgi:superfamily II DNA or RNA helicase